MPADQTADETLCEEVFAYYHAAYARTYRNTRECYKGIPETIAALKRCGYRLAVLSNKQDEYTKGLIEQLLPRDTFEVVMGQTELPTKPSPVVPSLIAGQLGLAPSECAMIGDSDVDIQTAKNAGMAAIGCSWGYRGRAALEQAGADVVVDEAQELLQILVQKSN
jgi:phosphoglycolate phosphatase